MPSLSVRHLTQHRPLGLPFQQLSHPYTCTRNSLGNLPVLHHVSENLAISHEHEHMPLHILFQDHYLWAQVYPADQS